MPTSSRVRLRLGAAALALSTLLLAVFPLVRPFFRLDVSSPTLAAVASPSLASPAWVIAHLLLLVGFALLPLGLLAIYATLADTPAEPRALSGTGLSILGLGLVMPMVGVEAFSMPLIGQLYLDGVTGIGPALAGTYRGPGTLVMLVGLLLLAVGSIRLARAIWRTRALPRWAAVALAAGLALWLPLLPRAIRVADGLLIGLGGVAVAWALWRDTGSATSLTASEAGETTPASFLLPERRDQPRPA
jgi:hypothetical protein